MKLCKCGHSNQFHVSSAGHCGIYECKCLRYKEQEWVMLDEVIGWIESNIYTKPELLGMYLNKEVWETKKKEWGKGGK